jgi:hypothetical protein
VLFAVVIPLILYNLYTGLVIGKIEVPGVFTVEFRDKTSPMHPGAPEKLPDGERAQGQAELEKRVRDMEDRLHSSEQERRSVPFQQQFDLNGTWHGPLGLSYVIRQSGNVLTIQEISPIYGITAAGEGVITHQDITITYMAADYTPGRGALRLSDDGMQITGTFTNLSTGISTSATLFR